MTNSYQGPPLYGSCSFNSLNSIGISGLTGGHQGIKASVRTRENMQVEIQLPEKCLGCAKSKGSSASEKCDFCGKIDFYESVLCDLNRSVQEPADFLCHAFQPILKLARPAEEKESHIPVSLGGISRIGRFNEMLSSEKYKYQKALALQKHERDPDHVFMNLKYHFAWNVIHRRSLFILSEDYSAFVHDIFFRCRELVGGFSSLIWLAPDHIHVYVESDGDESPDTLVKGMKEFSRKNILREFSDLKGKIDPEMSLWDEAYFVETVE